MRFAIPKVLFALAAVASSGPAVWSQVPPATPNLTPDGAGWTLTAVEEAGRGQLRFEGSGGLRLVCPSLTFYVTTNIPPVPFAASVEGKQVRVQIGMETAGKWLGYPIGIRGQADSVTRGGADGEVLTFAGNARLYMCLSHPGQPKEVIADRVILNLRTCDVQSCAGAPVPFEGRHPLPPYTVEPPDVLSITVGSMQPESPYRIEPCEALKVQITGDDENHLLAGEFTVASDGTIDLGPAYGTIHVAGRTLAEAEAAIQRHLKRSLHARVSLTLIQPRSRQQVSGEHLIRPDGTISLGTYGSLHVAGMTVAQVKAAVEEYLGEFADGVEVSVDVVAYNSKVCYVISDGHDSGETVERFPLVGNETVLDAIVNIPDLHSVSKCRIWVARPSDKGQSPSIFMVDWRGITQRGEMATNYALEAGDRIFVKKRILEIRD